jgi:hypothetical protein
MTARKPLKKKVKLLQEEQEELRGGSDLENALKTAAGCTRSLSSRVSNKSVGKGSGRSMSKGSMKGSTKSVSKGSLGKGYSKSSVGSSKGSTKSLGDSTKSLGGSTKSLGGSSKSDSGSKSSLRKRGRGSDKGCSNSEAEEEEVKSKKVCIFKNHCFLKPLLLESKKVTLTSNTPNYN